MTSQDFWFGYLCAAAGTGALFFFRYWRTSGDRLFLAFGIAFLLLAANWATLGLTTFAVEARHYAYLIRLLGFVVILIGIVDKNSRGC